MIEILAPHGKFEPLISGYFTLPSFSGFGNKRNSELFVLRVIVNRCTLQKAVISPHWEECISVQGGEKEKAHSVHPVCVLPS